MNKKLLSLLGMIPLLIAGYYLFQNVSGNTDLMLAYLEESDEITLEYNQLFELEASIESDEEFEEFTRDVLIPSLKELIAKSEAFGNTIEKAELKEVHDLHNEALKNHLNAELAWLEGDEAADDFYEESDRLYYEYEDALNKLAKKWGVEIEWEE